MAMFNDSYTIHLEEILTCDMCSDQDQEPDLLLRSHTSSFSSIDKSVKINNSNCSLQDDIKTDENNIPPSQSNVNLSTDQSSTQQCDNCDENEAINWCEKCGCQYCEACTKEIHAKKALQFHTIISLMQKMQSFCVNHLDEKLKFWCKNCEILVCRDCIVFEHKEHTISSLKDATAEAKAKFQETVQEITEIKRNLTTSLETTNKIINQRHQLAEQQKQDIEQTFADLQHRLDERKLAILQQLKDRELQTINILDQQRNTIDQHLKLTIEQELYIRKMLDSTDLMQILKFKSTLYHKYDDFIKRSNKIDDGYIAKTHLFKKDDRDVEQIGGIISKFGHINSTSWMIKGDTVTVKTASLDISRPGGTTGFISKESNYARGYKFILRNSLKLRSIQIHSDQVGQITGCVVNDIGIIIQKGTINPIHSTNVAMKWLSIPIECEIQNNYSILVLTPSNNGSYTYKNGDTQPRIIDQNCSVESKYVHSVVQIHRGSRMIVENNSASIDMILDIEE